MLIASTGLLVGCNSLTVEQEMLLAAARSIEGAPIKREVLLSTLGLEETKSVRLDGSIRSRRMSFVEFWHHESGLAVVAYDSEKAGETAILVPTIDPANRKADDYIGKPVGPPRPTFESFVIARGDRVIFRSDQ